LRIVEALDPKAGETIVEIGAGRGELTRHLLASGANVIAIELDRNLIPFVKREFGANENFSVIEEDALEIDFAKLISTNPKSQIQIPKSKRARLIANLPYNISTAILQKLIEQRNCFEEMILMFQREVVERIIAKPSTSERGYLSVLVETFLEAKKLFDVAPDAFRPAPKVWSAVVRLTPKPDPKISNEDQFRKIVSTGFSHRRKMLLNNFKTSHADLRARFEACGGIENVFADCAIDARGRAESLTSEEWIRLANHLSDSN
jgi:16S rRNA (adenine1518-N6/adenine1519-N6)-dimethyltransferase